MYDMCVRVSQAHSAWILLLLLLLLLRKFFSCTLHSSPDRLRLLTSEVATLVLPKGLRRSSLRMCLSDLGACVCTTRLELIAPGGVVRLTNRRWSLAWSSVSSSSSSSSSRMPPMGRLRL